MALTVQRIPWLMPANPAAALVSWERGRRPRGPWARAGRAAPLAWPPHRAPIPPPARHSVPNPVPPPPRHATCLATADWPSLAATPIPWPGPLGQKVPHTLRYRGSACTGKIRIDSRIGGRNWSPARPACPKGGNNTPTPIRTIKNKKFIKKTRH